MPRKREAKGKFTFGKESDNREKAYLNLRELSSAIAESLEKKGFSRKQLQEGQGFRKEEFL